MELLYISFVKIEKKTLKTLAFEPEHGIIISIIYSSERMVFFGDGSGPLCMNEMDRTGA